MRESLAKLRPLEVCLRAEEKIRTVGYSNNVVKNGIQGYTIYIVRFEIRMPETGLKKLFSPQVPVF